MITGIYSILFCSTIYLSVVSAFNITKDVSICYNYGRYYSSGKFKCIPKCCPHGTYLIGYKKCQPAKLDNNFSEVLVYNSKFEKIGKNLSEVFTFVPGKLKDPDFNRNSNDYFGLEHNYYITEEGILYEEIPNTFNRWKKFNSSEYCIDYEQPMPRRNITYTTLRYIILNKIEDNDHNIQNSEDPFLITIGLLVSCIFLILVFLVYALLKELRNLSGLVLMAYVMSLCFAFGILGGLQIKQHTPVDCKRLTYAIYFFFLASFCWMNIMSCDIWWTFRGYAKARPIHRRGEFFKFCMYCIYAFGMPAILTTVLVVLNETDMRHVPWFVTPKIPLQGCFIAGVEKLVYLYAPMMICICCNWVFFLMTAFNIWRLHRATAVLDSAAAGTPAAHRSQKYRFLVYLKLSIIMGINWILEVASSFSPDFKGWYLTDIYNMLIGFSIFLIFVCKKKILRMLIKRFTRCGDWHGKRPWYSRSRSSNTTESDVSDMPPVCVNPKGSMFFDKR